MKKTHQHGVSVVVGIPDWLLEKTPGVPEIIKGALIQKIVIVASISAMRVRVEYVPKVKSGLTERVKTFLYRR